MYVGTIVEYDDQSQISALPIADVRTQPLYLALFTSDKGPEEWTVMSGKDWFKAYGDSISFARHGQPLLQAAMSINAGARLLSKRLVADDATLANIGIVATVSSTPVQATDANGNYIYLDANGEDTIEVTETPKMIDKATVKYSAKSAEKVASSKEAFDAIKGTLAADDYLLFVITDNGRGECNKRIKIIPNYRLSKSMSYIQYNLYVTENGTDLETLPFNPDPSLVANGRNISLESVMNSKSAQLKCVQDEEGLNSFMAKLSEITKKPVTEIAAIDYLFGCNKKGADLDYLSVDETGINLQQTFGQALTNGSAGSMTNSPFQNGIVKADVESVYVKQAEEALDGTYSTEIFNLDQHKIDLIIDANYPAGVKRAIETLVVFREDCVFMRDMGLGLTTLDMINDANFDLVKSKFIATYSTSYDVIDPYSKKQIPVTIGYTLCRKMVDLLNTGRVLPVAGIKYGMIIDDAIKGTVNFCPTVCPDPLGNQKEKMEEECINYCTYINNELVLETEYTSQEELTQFSFLNNVLGTQEVVRAVRTRCPVIRYTFIDGQDLELYKSDINEVLSEFTSNFKLLEMEYIADETFENNKIFYAAIKVCHRDFIQTEWLKITALNVEEV